MTNADTKPARFTRLRALIFLLLSLAIGAALIVAMTFFVIGSAPRSTAVAVADGITVSEFVTLPDDDAYPAALAIDADGTLYTGSYQTGAIWSISPDGSVREIDDSRELIGSVTGLDVAPDGALYILDRISPLESRGALVWRYAQAELRSIVQFPPGEDGGISLPDDIALDKHGVIYISDRDPARIWRYKADKRNLSVWWRPPPGAGAAPTGLAYDAARQAVLVTEGGGDAVYRVSVDRVSAAAQEIGGELNRTETLFADEDGNDFGFDGITVTPDGEIYIALLNWNRVAKLVDGELLMLAKDFRGASDLAYDSARDRLYVTNWNQFSLGFGTRPQLPFALDVIDLSPRPEQSDA